MTIDKRAWIIFFVVLAVIIGGVYLFMTPTSVEVKSKFGPVERLEPNE